MILKKASLEDAEQLHEMQRRSFSQLLQKYQDYETNPAAESLEKTIERLQRAGSDYYYIMVNGEKAGAIRVQRQEAECYRIGLYVLPEYQGNGYAQQALSAIEALYPFAKSWNLDTIKQEPKLCHLYEKMGYRRTGKENTIKEGMTLVFYEKLKKHGKDGKNRSL